MTRVLLNWGSWWGLALAGGYPCCCADGPGSSPPGSSDGSSVPLETVTCEQCAGDVASAWYAVDLSGIVNDFGFCPQANCGSLDGLYVVGPLQSGSVGGVPPLAWCAADVPIVGVCRDDNSCFAVLHLAIYRPTTGLHANQYILQVQLVSQGDCDEEGGLPVMHFTHVFGVEKPDCLDAFPITIAGGEVDYALSPKCSAAGATCTVSLISAP